MYKALNLVLHQFPPVFFLSVMRYEADHAADRQLIVSMIGADSAQQRISRNKHNIDSNLSRGRFNQE